MPRLLFPEFREEQQISRYPFGDNCDLITDGNLVLDPGLLLDASLFPIGDYPQLSLRTITVAYTQITFTIGNDTFPDLLSGTYDPASPPEVVTLYQDDRIGGMLVPDLTTLAVLQSWPAGVHTFPSGSAEFVPSVNLSYPDPGVTGFVLPDGDIVSGDIWLVGDAGVVLSNPEENVIRFDIVGDPLFRRRQCETEDTTFATPSYLKTINQLPPDSLGNFRILVGSLLNLTPALRIEPTNENGLHIYVAGNTLIPQDTALRRS